MQSSGELDLGSNSASDTIRVLNLLEGPAGGADVRLSAGGNLQPAGGLALAVSGGATTVGASISGSPGILGADQVFTVNQVDSQG